MYNVESKKLAHISDFFKSGVGSQDALTIRFQPPPEPGDYGDLLVSSCAKNGVGGTFSAIVEELAADSIIREGISVSANVFCDLASKVDGPCRIRAIDYSGNRHLMILGERFRFEIPAIYSEPAMEHSVQPLAFASIESLELAMRTLRSAKNEGKDENPVAWIKTSSSGIKMFATMAYRGVVIDICDFPSGFSGFEPKVFGIPFSCLSLLEKAFSAHRKESAPARKAKETDSKPMAAPPVAIGISGSTACFSMGSERRIYVRRMAGIQPPNVELLFSRAEENKVVEFLVNGKQIRDAWSRLSAFAKRDKDSPNRINFEHTGSSLSITSSGGDIGSGKELVNVDTVFGDPGFCWSAAGEKLVDMITVSRVETIRMSAGRSNMLICWVDTAGSSCMAMVAGMRPR